ncbi:MAG: ATP-binding protein [Sphaerochaeta sp.]|nr:ATP-binding protein [Sphaerochaeta sp.]
MVVLDEYPYLKETKDGGVVDSCFQRIIDKRYVGLSLVLCGSSITVMTELLERDNPLFGRFDGVMQVLPFDYLDASLFYLDLPVREKIAMYSVFGDPRLSWNGLMSTKTWKGISMICCSSHTVRFVRSSNRPFLPGFPGKLSRGLETQG